MNLQETFLQHLKQFTFLQKKELQLLAVSGGVDSVVLCNLMFASEYDFVIAHCNFKLRGSESERDEQFVRDLGKRYGKEVLVKKFDTEKHASDNKVSIQVAARELRYDWFKLLVNDRLTMNKEQWSTNNEQQKNLQFIAFDSQLTTLNSQLPLHYILTAHHANDNIETMLMNFFKGTGISGLHGILPVQQKMVRPLLFAKKEEILAYAKEKDLVYVEDSSNLSDKYSRNFLRHKLLPVLKEIYPAVEDNLLNNIKRFGEAEQLFHQSIINHKKKLLEIKGNETHIPVLKLQKVTPLSTILYEIIKDFGFTASQVNEVEKLLESETGKYVVSSSHRVIKNRSWLIISSKQTTEASNILIEKGDKKIIFGGGELQFEIVKNANTFQIPYSNNIATLDYAEVNFPLLLRKWKQGDYFYPLGMKKKKKLSRFFTDQKLSKTDKENIWLLEVNKKIVWIVGQRIDDRFKVKTSTKQIVKIAFRSL